MRKRTLIFFVVAMSVMVFYACSKKEKTDVVTGIEPVRQAIGEHVATLDALRNVKPEDQAEFIKKNWPNLSRDLVASLSSRGIIKPGDKVTSINYTYGSAESVKGEDKKGKLHQGIFKDELIATIKTEKLNKPIILAVRCSNGLFDLKGKFANIFSETPETIFTITKGEGLCNHVSYDVAIDLAEKHHLALYRGKGRKERHINVAEARSLRDQTDYVNVTVGVYPGDQFNLIDGTYTKAKAK